MNSFSGPHSITSYQDLQAERNRLEELINQQKNLVRMDIEKVKEEIKVELKPAIDAANFVKKFTTRESRNETFLQVGSTLIIDLLVRKLFVKSGMVLRLLAPSLVTNYSSNFVFKFFKNLVSHRQEAQTVGKQNGHYHINPQH